VVAACQPHVIWIKRIYNHLSKLYPPKVWRIISENSILVIAKFVRKFCKAICLFRQPVRKKYLKFVCWICRMLAWPSYSKNNNCMPDLNLTDWIHMTIKLTSIQILQQNTKTIFHYCSKLAKIYWAIKIKIDSSFLIVLRIL